jgi:hypothetical protein
MAEITIVRHPDIQLTEAEKDIARRFLFGFVDGLGEQGKRQWRRLWKNIMHLEPGEMVDIKTHQDRIGWFHRKHMALEQAIYESQERFENFDAFRVWLKVGSGFVDWFPGPKGGVIPVPRSISYAKLEQVEMEKVHADMVQFVRQPHALKTLWPHLSEAQREEMIETVLGGFGE